MKLHHLVVFAALFATALGCGPKESGAPNVVDDTDDASHTDDAAQPDAGTDDGGTDAAVPDGPGYYEAVKPIVDAKCATCHYEGGIAPFQLLTYDDAYQTRELIKAAVADRRMPPFLPDSTCREYAHDFSLTPEQIETITSWVDAGAPEGDPANEGDPLEIPQPEPPTLDTTLEMPVEYTPRQSPDDYRCFVIDWPFEEDRYITGFGVEPGEDSIVHHVIAFGAPPALVEEAMANDEAEEGPGYTCFGGPGLETSQDRRPQWLGSWAPGGMAAKYPEGTGLLIPGGSKVVLQVHYNTLGKEPIPDRTSVSFETADTVEHRAFFLPWANPLWLNSTGMRIPAGESDATHRFQYDPTQFFNGRHVNIWSAGLHMHLLGTSAKTWIQRADGDEECLVDIPRWDFNWQSGVAFAEVATLEPGDRLSLECHWDNTADNQPVVNGERVTPEDRFWGEGTLDEMCLGVYYVTLGE